MPCLILTGNPCVGKSTLAQLIQQRVQWNNNDNNNKTAKKSWGMDRVVIVNEATACPGRTLTQCYATTAAEKQTRGAVKAAFDRAVADASACEKKEKVLIVLDSLNYIKGFRYELHCISKAAGQQHGVIWVLNSLQVAKEWNQQRRRQQQQQQNDNMDLCYSDELMDELMQRYEPPDERNRWDKPLYKMDMRPPDSKLLATNKSGDDDDDGAGESLQKSVYNMHALSEVIHHKNQTNTNTSETAGVTELNENNNNTQGGTTCGGSSNETAEPPKKAKAFKGFKRAAKNSKTVKPVQTADTIPSAAVGNDDIMSANLNKNMRNLGEEVVLYPKDFLYSSQPMTTATRTTATDNDDMDPQDEQQQQQYDNNNARYKQSKKPASQQQALQQTTPKNGTLEEQVDAILESFLLHTKALTQGTSTQPTNVAVGSNNALHEMDVVTQTICDNILQAQQELAALAPGQPQSLPIPISSDTTTKNNTSSLVLETHRPIPMAELKRLRRQYLRWVATNPPEDCHTPRGIANSFVAYITAQVE